MSEKLKILGPLVLGGRCWDGARKGGNPFPHALSENRIHTRRTHDRGIRGRWLGHVPDPVGGTRTAGGEPALRAVPRVALRAPAGDPGALHAPGRGAGLLQRGARPAGYLHGPPRGTEPPRALP